MTKSHPVRPLYSFNDADPPPEERRRREMGDEGDDEGDEGFFENVPMEQMYPPMGGTDAEDEDDLAELLGDGSNQPRAAQGD